VRCECLRASTLQPLDVSTQRLAARPGGKRRFITARRAQPCSQVNRARGIIEKFFMFDAYKVDERVVHTYKVDGRVVHTYSKDYNQMFTI